MDTYCIVLQITIPQQSHTFFFKPMQLFSENKQIEKRDNESLPLVQEEVLYCILIPNLVTTIIHTGDKLCVYKAHSFCLA